MLSISVRRVVLAVCVVSVSPYLGNHVSADDENVVFRDAMNKRGELIVEGDDLSFFTNLGRAVTGDDCYTEVATKCSYHHPWVYFLYAI